MAASSASGNRSTCSANARSCGSRMSIVAVFANSAAAAQGVDRVKSLTHARAHRTSSRLLSGRLDGKRKQKTPL